MPSARWRLRPPSPLAIAAAVAAAFILALLASTEGHFVPQVADLYVICQYARGFAEGHAFRYNPGDPPSTGSTSLLHTVLLAVAHALGARGEGLVAAAIGLGVLFYLASVVLAGRLALRLPPRPGDDDGRVAWLAGTLVALGGPVVWGFLYGADIALFMLLTLASCATYLADWCAGRARAWPLAGVLVALARPEGLPLGLLLAIAWQRGPGRLTHLAQRVWAWAPALVGLGLLAAQRALTGNWLGSSLADKALVPNYGWLASLGLSAEYGLDVLRGLLLGLYPSQAPIGFYRGFAAWCFPPLGLLLVLAALGGAAHPARTALRVWIVAAALVGVAVAPNTFLGVHFNRYLLWLFPVLLVLVAHGLGVAARAGSGGDARRESQLFSAGAGLLVLLGALATARLAAHYGESGGELWRREVQAARWMAQHLPADASVANAATSVDYLSGRRGLNLHGVMTPAFFGTRKAEREAGMFEALARLAPAERPGYLLSSESQQRGLLSLQALAEEPPLFRTRSLGDELLLFRLRAEVLERSRHWRLPATAAALVGRSEVDRLNVGDARDEREHGYAFSSSAHGLALYAAVRAAAYAHASEESVVDAGRVILGSESFSVRARPGADLWLVVRTAADARAQVLRPGGPAAYELQLEPAHVRVSIGGRVVAQVTRTPAAGWDEWLLRLPAAALDPGGRTRLDLAGQYASFYYWFLQ